MHRSRNRVSSLACRVLSGLAAMACSTEPSVNVWLESGSGRDALRFGIGTEHGRRAPVQLRSIRVEQCTTVDQSSSPRTPAAVMWLAANMDRGAALDSTFVYGIAPQGLVTRQGPTFLARGCYLVAIVAATDTARGCFLVHNSGSAEPLALGTPGCSISGGRRE